MIEALGELLYNVSLVACGHLARSLIIITVCAGVFTFVLHLYSNFGVYCRQQATVHYMWKLILVYKLFSSSNTKQECKLRYGIKGQSSPNLHSAVECQQEASHPGTRFHIEPCHSCTHHLLSNTSCSSGPVK